MRSGSASRGVIALEIGARQRAADAFEIGRHLAPDIAAIEIVEPGMGELFERRGQRFLLEDGADRGNFAVDQECFGKARHALQGFEAFQRQPLLAARDGIAVARLRDGRREQQRERHFSAGDFCGFEREHPAADRARHGQRRKRPARRDRFVVAIKLRPGLLRRTDRRP